MASEFNIIRQYFSAPQPGLRLGVGDDCALLDLPTGMTLASSTDILLENQHFFPDVDPAALGHKALAVNLSDLAAMGARPLGFLLGLGLPEVNHEWLAGFSNALLALADKAQCPLAGGDTTRSRQGIVITITALGYVNANQALRRDAAQVHDDIWLTGDLGGPDIALRLLNGQLPENGPLLESLRSRLEWPLPPYRLAPALCGIARAAIDVSDGLMQDLQHILDASECGAVLYEAALPIHSALNALNRELKRQAVLGGGDVFQLCFTAPPNQEASILRLASQYSTRVSKIGTIVKGRGIHLLDARQRTISWHGIQGFDHFSQSES